MIIPYNDATLYTVEYYLDGTQLDKEMFIVNEPSEYFYENNVLKRLDDSHILEAVMNRCCDLERHFGDEVTYRLYFSRAFIDDPVRYPIITSTEE